jgi:hypothetical protein
MGNITSADATLTLTIPPLFPVPQQLQGFATDDVYDIPAIKSVETMMGVDGVLSGGFVFTAIVQQIHLQADSASNLVFDTWWTQMVAAKLAYSCGGLIKLPGILTKFTQTNGFLTGYKPPGAKRVLQPRSYEITWQMIAPAPSLG